MAELRFSNTHEWVKVDGKEALVGISDYAQHSLGDVVFVDLPSVGDTFSAGDEFGAIESVKAASELNIPIGGKVIAVNDALLDHPETINKDPLNTWLIKIEVASPIDLSHLLTLEAYEKIAK
ncbi:MAG TPA: glycine cleavage system protein GcvH [Bacilli bacterium]|nr:glycine cleavage system protein GcvH [Bacilli bacterium]